MHSGVMQPGFKFQLCHVQVAIPQKYKLATQVHKGNLLSCHRWLFRLICYEGMVAGGGVHPQGPSMERRSQRVGRGACENPNFRHLASRNPSGYPSKKVLQAVDQRF